MNRVVVDASAWIELVCRGHRWKRLIELVDSEEADVHVPALCDVEVVAGLRKLVQRGRIDLADAEEALEDYLASAIHRHDHEPWLWRLFELRDNFTPYDAPYVALAETLDATLVTVDARLARAAGSHLGIATAP